MCVCVLYVFLVCCIHVVAVSKDTVNKETRLQKTITFLKKTAMKLNPQTASLIWRITDACLTTRVTASTS